MVPIRIRLLRMSFECFQFAFEWLESVLIGSNLHLITSNLVRMLPICIQMVINAVEWFESTFDSFEVAFKW